MINVRTTPSPAGALEHVVSGLEPNTRYFFVVRSRDEAGNFDANLVEASALTPGDRAAKAVTVGDGHACALLARGTVRCWGDNDYGQLGDGTTVSREIAAPVVGLELVKLIEAGTDHTCAAIADGTVRCWGKNERGQLGDGTTEDSTLPVVVLGLGFVKALSAGDGHTCAILGNGSMRCWGANDRGQLGDGTYEDRLEPVEVAGAAYVKDLSCGAEHTCAVAADGLVACWGRGDSGQLGHGDFADQNVWATVDAPELATNVAAGGAHSCARIGDGTVACWGANDAGQLGSGVEAAANPLPSVAANLAHITGLRASGTGACARVGDGTLRCWGGGVPEVSTPAGIDQVDGFDFGASVGCARRANGGVACWAPWGGLDLYANTSSQVYGLKAPAAPIELTASAAATCAVLSDGSVSCWGTNGLNDLGNWSLTGDPSPPETSPVQVVDVGNAFRAVAIWNRTCVGLGDGRMRCWGQSSPSMLGGGPSPATPPYVPVFVDGFEGAYATGSGSGQIGTCVGNADGRLYCWKSVSTLISTPRNVIGVSNVGTYLASDGRIRDFSTPPSDVDGVLQVDRLVYLDSNSGLNAVRADGAVWIWQHQLPLEGGGYWSVDVPTRLGGFSHVVKMDSAGTQVLAGLRSDGHIQTWGTGGTTGGYYRLGVADPNATTWGWKKGPGALDTIFTADLIENAIDVSVESAISPASCCALIADGTVKCWGSLQSTQGNGFKLLAIYIPKVMPYLP